MQMIKPGSHKLSISQQCRLLIVNRSTFYYQPQPANPQDQEPMRLIDEIFMNRPNAGTHAMRNHLRRLGYKLNRKKVQRLMRQMGIEAIYSKPKTSRPHPQHKVYPCFTNTLKCAGVTISMDGRGRAMENIFIERLWWTIKYHYLCLHAFNTGSELRCGLTHWFKFCNSQRPHQGFDDMTPDEVNFGLPHPYAQAA
jgi:transposase InsO family protein